MILEEILKKSPGMTAIIHQVKLLQKQLSMFKLEMKIKMNYAKQGNFEFAIHTSCERKKKKVILKLQDGNIIIGNVTMRKVFHFTMLLYTKVKAFLWKNGGLL